MHPEFCRLSILFGMTLKCEDGIFIIEQALIIVCQLDKTGSWHQHFASVVLL